MISAAASLLFLQVLLWEWSLMCWIKMYATGDVVQLFAAEDYLSRCALVNYRVKQFVYTCIRAVHHNRLVLSVLSSLTFEPLSFLYFLAGCYFPFSLLFFFALDSKLLVTVKQYYLLISFY